MIKTNISRVITCHGSIRSLLVCNVSYSNVSQILVNSIMGCWSLLHGGGGRSGNITHIMQYVKYFIKFIFKQLVAHAVEKPLSHLHLHWRQLIKGERQNSFVTLVSKFRGISVSQWLIHAWICNICLYIY